MRGVIATFSHYLRLCSDYPLRGDLPKAAETFRMLPVTCTNPFKMAMEASAGHFKRSALVAGAILKIPAASGRHLKHSDIFCHFMLHSDNLLRVSAGFF